MDKLFRLPDFGKGIESYLIPVYYENPRWSLNSRLIRAGLVQMSLFVIIIIALPVLGDVFFSFRNLQNLSRQILPVIMAASVMVFLFSRGGIDFSFMMVGALAGTIMAVSLSAGLSLPLAMILALAAGLTIGILNGSIVGLLGLPGILVTLLTGFLVKMISLTLLNGQTLPLDLNPDVYGSVFGFMKVFGWLISLGLLATGIICFYFASVKSLSGL